MKEKIKNAWDWTKEHKYEICMTAIAAFSGFIVYKSYIRGNEVVDAIRNSSELPTVELAKGVSDFDGTLLQVNDTYALSDLGKLGEQIREFAPSVPDEIYIWGLLDPTETET